MSEETITQTQQPEPTERVADETPFDPDQKIPGTKLTYAEAERHGIPDKLVDALAHLAQQAHPRRLGIITSGGEWYVYRSISRREFKQITDEATERAIKKLEAAQQAGKNVTPAHMQMETQGNLEETIAAKCTLHPKLQLTQMGDYDAGLPKLLYDAIMARSAFDQEAQPLAL